MQEESKTLEASVQEQLLKEKQKYSDPMWKYEESLSLNSEVQTELTKLQLTMDSVNTSLEKVEVIKKYWSDKVYRNSRNVTVFTTVVTFI